MANPYVDDIKWHYAELQARLGAIVFDLCILFILLMALPFAVIDLIYTPHFLASFMGEDSAIKFLADFEGWSSFIFGCLILGIPLIYFAGFESSNYRATPGKKFYRLQVADEDGNKLNFKKALVRSSAFIFLGCSQIGWIASAVLSMDNDSNQMLHDTLTNSVVWQHEK